MVILFFNSSWWLVGSPYVHNGILIYPRKDFFVGGNETIETINRKLFSSTRNVGIRIEKKKEDRFNPKEQHKIH